MAGPKTIYVGDDDEPLWDEASKIAADGGSSLAAVVRGLVRRYVEQRRKTVGRLVVDMHDEAASQWREVFDGRWLVEPDRDDTRSRESDADAGTYYGVAVTARGRIVVHSAHCNDRWPPTLEDFDSLEHAEEAGQLPLDIATKASSELGEPRTIVRDW